MYKVANFMMRDMHHTYKIIGKTSTLLKAKKVMTNYSKHIKARQKSRNSIVPNKIYAPIDIATTEHICYTKDGHRYVTYIMKE